MVDKVKAAKAELPLAGPMHRRDLVKHIHRMERQIAMYDRYRGDALSHAKASSRIG